MLEDFKDKLIRLLGNRATYIIPVFLVFMSILIYRCFDLQIVHGEEYLNNFVLEQMKTKEISAKRGSIFDRNGNLLAYDELAYSIRIEDTFESGKSKNQKLNTTVLKLIELIEKNGDSIDYNFGIKLDEDGNFAFVYEGTSHLRFLADIYGYPYISELDEKEKHSTPIDVMNFLSSTKKFMIGEYDNPEDKKSEFVCGKNFSNEDWLKLVIIRYNMSLTSYRKYVGTIVATDISEKTVAVIYENSDVLPGVSITEETVRRYNDSIYFSHLLGYTGKISSEELEIQEEVDKQSGKEGTYNRNSIIGKSGIEKTMESTLRGIKGSQTLMVNATGKVLSVLDERKSTSGNDVYLTIDKDITIAAYKLVEQKLAGIIASKIVNTKTYYPDPESSTNDIIIPIYSVYYALIDNAVIDTKHFTSNDASDEEKELYEQYLLYEEDAFKKIEDELLNKNTPYKKLSKEFQDYEDNIINLLIKNNTINSSLIDSLDPNQIAWAKEETISISEYIKYCISAGWIDSQALMSDDKYSDSNEVYNKIISLLMEDLRNNYSFKKLFYKYILLNNKVKPELICKILCNQGQVDIPEEDKNKLFQGKMNAYTFMLNRINNIDVTPAQLALDPCNASCVLTDVNTGSVIAVVTYPGYDNNKMANSVDSVYYSKLLNDKSTPLYNFATQYKGAPGSTYKLVSSTAALCENIARPSTSIFCSGTYTNIDPSPKCWRVWGHGTETLKTAITDSCNFYFYDVGYKLSISSGKYVQEEGLEILARYADMYGLSEKTGVEMSEEYPNVSDFDPVRSAIGQGRNAFTTIGLARYAAAIANRGNVYNLTLIDSIKDSNQFTLFMQTPNLRNTIELEDSYWDTMHEGMRGVVQKMKYYSSLPVTSAGKTGTAQQSNIRPTHALYIGFAPYENPEVAIATRINFGYSSDYSAQLSRDILKVYFNTNDDELINGQATNLEGGSLNQN